MKDDVKFLAPFKNVSAIYDLLKEKAPYLTGVFSKQYAEFGQEWLSSFEKDVEQFFKGNRETMSLAVMGYTKFAIEGMLLQKRFTLSRQYEPKSYEEASQEVYQNKNYMFDLYLPGIFLSHFLWRHHYRQFVYFNEELLPLLKSHGGKKYYDVGVGTGFYSKEMLRHIPEMKGEGFDLSPFSLEYTTRMLTAWDFRNRYTPNLRNIITEPVKEPAPFVTCIEVLEHLEDPLTFLKALYKMLAPGGYGFISAAITAPNADHIYLYNNMNEVLDHLKQAGFKIVSSREDRAYEPVKPNDSVPINGVAIVTK